MFHVIQNPNSCVRHVRFDSFRLQQIFGYLRERELILQREYRSTGRHDTNTALDVVQGLLIWMVTNIEVRE